MAEAEWKLLIVKLLRDSDLRVKFRTPLEDHTDFIRSIPAPRDAIETYIKDGEIPAILHADQGDRLYAQSEVKFEIKIPGGNTVSSLNDPRFRCNLELPPLDGHFEYDLDVKMEYCWRDGKLHLRATMAYPIYTDIGQVPTPWRLLGEKRVVNTDVVNHLLRLPQKDRTEFYENVPAEELKQCLMMCVGLRARIWVGGHRCVPGMLKAAYSVQMDVTSMGIEITCKRAFENSGGPFYRVNEKVQIYYQWAYGIPYLAVVPAGSNPPRETGDRFSEI